MSEISKERIERAARPIAERNCGEIQFTGECDQPDVLCTCRISARAALEADAPAISDDHKAEARELAIALNVLPDEARDSPEIRAIAAALAAAEARGKAEGRSEEISLLNYIRAALPVLQTMTTRIGLPKGAKQAGEMLEAIDGRLSVLTGPSPELQSAAAIFTAAMAESTGRPVSEVADAARGCMDDLGLTPRRLDGKARLSALTASEGRGQT